MTDRSLLDTTINYRSREYRAWAKVELASLVNDLDRYGPKRDAFQPAFEATARVLVIGATLLHGSRVTAFLDDYLDELQGCQSFNIAEVSCLEHTRAFTSTVTTILTHTACLAQLPRLVTQIPGLRMTLYGAIQGFMAEDVDLNQLRVTYALRNVGDAFLQSQGPELLHAIRSLTNLLRPAMDDDPVHWADAFSLDGISASDGARHKHQLSIVERERRIVAALNRLRRRQKDELSRPAFDLTDVALMSQGMVQLASALQHVRRAHSPINKSVAVSGEQAWRSQVQVGSMLH